MRTEAEPESTTAEDTELVLRCQAGEAQAFNELVTKYRAKVYGMIYTMVRNEQDAWDLAQDGFVKAWKSIRHFRASPPSTPGFTAS